MIWCINCWGAGFHWWLIFHITPIFAFLTSPMHAMACPEHYQRDSSWILTLWNEKQLFQIYVSEALTVRLHASTRTQANTLIHIQKSRFFFYFILMPQKSLQLILTITITFGSEFSAGDAKGEWNVSVLKYYITMPPFWSGSADTKVNQYHLQ